MIDIPRARLEKFFQIAWERHKIYTLKTMMCPKPWTKDPIFLKYYFCNVFRRIDKTTVYLIDHVIKENENNPELWKSIMLFRFISRISTYEKLKGQEFNYSWMYKKLRNMQQTGEKIFTNAFIVNSRSPEGGWDDKVNYIFKLLRYFVKRYSKGYPTFDELLRKVNSVQEAYHILCQAAGIGPFMAYQYCMDFAYSTRYLAQAKDRYYWTHLGIGAVRGMNRLLHGEPKRNKILFDIPIACYIFNEWHSEIFKNLDKEIDKTYLLVKYTYGSVDREMVVEHYRHFRHLHMGDVEHWLCENDKYMRGGSKKRRYNGV